MNDNVLLPEKEVVKVGGRTYSIGELSLNQFMKLSKFLAKTVLSSQKKLKELKDKTSNDTSNTEDILTILDLLDDKDTVSFLGILLKEDDIDFLEKNLSLTKSTEIVAIVCEHNDIDLVKKNIQRILKATKLIKTP